jgi:DNA transformation protein
VSGRSEFVERALARLLPMGPVRARAMFGGWGLFLDDVMFALIAGERLYFKVDAETEARFAAAGAQAFTYARRGARVAMSYREAPAGTLEAAEALLPWAELGLDAARRNRRRKRSLV